MATTIASRGVFSCSVRVLYLEMRLLQFFRGYLSAIYLSTSTSETASRQFIVRAFQRHILLGGPGHRTGQRGFLPGGGARSRQADAAIGGLRPRPVRSR